MGQAAARRDEPSNGATICCTIREPAREPASPSSAPTPPTSQRCTTRGSEGGSAREVPSKGPASTAGPVLSTPWSVDSSQGSRRQHFDPLCNVECVADRNCGDQFRQVLSGDRPWKRKQVIIQAMQEEEIHLSRALKVLAFRISELNADPEGMLRMLICDEARRMTPRRLTPRGEPDGNRMTPGGMSATLSGTPEIEVAPASPVGGSSATPSEWARRLLQTEGQLKGVPASLVMEACRATFQGDGQQLVDEEAFKTSYAVLLEESRRLADSRLGAACEELARLKEELEELEELMTICFEDIDVDGTGEISLQRFVESLCPRGDENQLLPLVGPDEVERLFMQMSKGAKAISLAQFKEELTIAGLHAVHRNITIRRSLEKRYRDTWF